VCIVGATAFVDTQSEAAAALGPLESCPVAHACLEKELNLSTPIDALLDMGSMLWPERHRYLADTLWSNSPPATVLGTLREQFLQAPSAKSLAVFVFSTGAAGPAAPLPDAAFSMTAGALLLCYAIWEHPEDDAANAAWHRKTITALDPFAVGHYVGESDIVADPVRAQRSFAPANWQRLKALRRKYDPDGLFHARFGAR
jgi:FAD/FMN-containing dehydrogenase